VGVSLEFGFYPQVIPVADCAHEKKNAQSTNTFAGNPVFIADSHL
jgi:hypothetical protein